DYKKIKKFVGIISRAFAELEKFVVLTRHLLMPGGIWVAMKGVSPDQELQQLPTGVVLKRVISLQVPGINNERCLAILKEA
ncbi:MAG: RsmG family class I SAM-dependent methyltransferase, partial [Candidatus Nitrotoga sp.]